MSSKKVAELSAPAGEPDLGSFELDKDQRMPLWMALKDVMKDAKISKFSNANKDKQMWKVFFREPGQPLAAYGHPIRSSNTSVARVRDEIGNAEMATPARPARAPSKNRPATRDSTYGGGDMSSFRVRLRGKSMAMRKKRTQRRKSYATATTMPGLPDGMTVEDLVGGENGKKSKRRSRPGLVASRRMSVGSPMVVAVDQVPLAVPTIDLDA